MNTVEHPESGGSRRAPPPGRQWGRLGTRVLRVPGAERAVVYRVPQLCLGILTPLRGRCRVEADGSPPRCTSLVPGEVCRVPQGQTLRFATGGTPRSPTEIAVVELAWHPVDEAGAGGPGGPGGLPPERLTTLRSFDPHLAAIAAALVDAAAAGADERYGAAAAHYLATHLLVPQTAAVPRPGGLTTHQLELVRCYVQDNLAGPITLDDLAARVRLSRYHFARRFAAAARESPLQYVTRLRVDSARRPLRTEDTPVSQVGRACGFPGADSFARAFRRHVGCSPSEFRRRARHPG
ncbi:AraC family transcriptional regulator [Streptomyces lonarensis]|uniref:AraC family transcriptional regulator n=1 Tax=Streptomyces lonarensis TaxID=700599 RepID=UPI0030C77E26